MQCFRRKTIGNGHALSEWTTLEFDLPGSGLFSSTTQHAGVFSDYCDGLNISDYNCRRISRINFFADALPSGVPVLWDNNHGSVPVGDSEPPYDEGWGDPRMVASPGICSPGRFAGFGYLCEHVTADHSSYSCMALVFDPPIPMGWNIEYRWTVGARQPARDSQVRGTAVDIRFRADTGSNSDIQLADEQGRFRENTRYRRPSPHGNTRAYFRNFGSAVPEIRWCFFSSNIRQSVRNLARIDGVLFGTDDGEEFCRPELNAGDDDCLPGHNAFDRSLLHCLGCR